jgi:aminoglycoside 2''-phosphotransferase
MNISTTHLERIHTLRPELAIESARLCEEALDNDVINVDGPDGAWIFRFAKTVDRQQRMAVEIRRLDQLHERITLQVPRPIIRENDLMAYRRIEGEPLTAWLIASLDATGQQRLANQLGAFLRVLHSTPADEALDKNGPEAYCALAMRQLAEYRVRLYPHLMAFQREWIELLFKDALRNVTFFEYTPALLHNDFKVDHILFDATQQRISGVIDFGWACYGDPSIDICNLLQWYGETFVSRLCKTYPEMQSMMPRARFGAFLCELDWLLQGLEPGGLHWFFANLATNRDIRFPIFSESR